MLDKFQQIYNIKKTILKIFILFSFIVFCSSAFSDTQELEIYNEWFSPDCVVKSDKPYFFIRDRITFMRFWEKTKLVDKLPYIDFDKFMILVWLPGFTRKDLSKVYFESVRYKDGCLQILIDFADDYIKYIGKGSRPVKFAIIPHIQPCDVFVFKKVKIGYKKYDWKPIYTKWDMSGIREKSFQVVMVDKAVEQEIELPKYIIQENESKNDEEELEETQEEVPNPNNTETTNVKPVIIVKTSSPIRKQNSYASVSPTTPISSVAAVPVMKQKEQTQTPKQPQPQKNVSVVKDEPINLGRVSTETNTTSKPESVPGMGDDTVFGSEFDIQF